MPPCIERRFVSKRFDGDISLGDKAKERLRRKTNTSDPVWLMKFIIWLKALRAHFLTATIVPFFLGGAITFYLTGTVDLALFSLTGIGLVFLHLGTNLANDYFDFIYGADSNNRNASMYSGGSQAIVKGSLSQNIFLASFVLLFLSGSAIGAYLVLKTGNNMIIWVGIFGLLSGYFYTAHPLKLAYRGMGEILIGINLGPLISTGTYLVQTGYFSLHVFMLSLSPGILMIAMLVLNEFPDYESDRAAGKKNAVVRLGKKNAVTLFHVLIYTVLLYKILGIACGLFPVWSAMVFLSVPLAARALAIANDFYLDTTRLMLAIKYNIQFHLAFGLLLSLSFFLGAL